MRNLPGPSLWLSIIVVLLLVAGASGSLSFVDRWLLDDFLARQAADRALPEEVVLIEIDQKSLEEMNAMAGSWPWPRAVHGELIEKLAKARPKAIVLDLLLNEPDTFRPESDAYFAEVAGQFDNVYLPTLLMSDGTGAPATAFPESLGIEPGSNANPEATLPLLVPLIVPPESWRGGTINFHAGADGTGRQYFLKQEHAGWNIPSMPKKLADDLGWQVPRGYAFFLNWYGTIPHQYSYSDVFSDLTSSDPELTGEFSNKIIIVGAAAPGLGDLRPTPLGKTYQGVLILATAIGNLFTGDWLMETGYGSWLYFIFLPALLLAWFRGLHLLPVGSILLVSSVLVVYIQYYLMKQEQLIVHTGGPLAASWLVFIALVVANWWQERQQREQAVALFGRFLDPRVVTHLVEDNAIADAQATRSRELTILFSDIRGFTTLSEKSTPEQVVKLLNDYFSRQVEVIFGSQGTLDKFIGDAIMAFWGAPADDPAHAYHAVTAALDMVDELHRFRAGLGEEGEGFDVGIGIHTGPAVVGFIGSSDRLDYTVIGDSVNLSSRIEGKTKGVARILVSESTRRACEASHPGALDFIDHGEVHVKGREQGVRLYEPRRKE